MRQWFVSAGLALAGCVSITPSSFGTFAGVMPCADCAGILTELHLYTEQGRPTRYELMETYMGTRDGDRSIGTAGRWATVSGSADDRGATVVQLDLGSAGSRRNFLRVGADELRRLDLNRKEIPTAAPHTLHRVSELPPATLLEGDSGRTIEVERGQRVYVVLAADRTTGYDWMLEASGTALLTSLGNPIYAQSADLAGSGGTRVWFFGAVGAGKQELVFRYRRPWEQGVPAAKTVTFAVTVR
ncbi:MAG TPA: protease inhibitor I42 family protein [Burkholderiales bacterium]|nr:protease inhibitor I42 family protein [Burkholderiales bacterium]